LCRHAGIPTEVLEDGFEGWSKGGLPLVNTATADRPTGPYSLGHPLPAQGRSHRLVPLQGIESAPVMVQGAAIRDRKHTFCA
jgi:hypothetical protein